VVLQDLRYVLAIIASLGGTTETAARASIFDSPDARLYDARDSILAGVARDMFTAWVRKVSASVLAMFGRLVVRLGISADALTVLGCLLNIGVGVVLATGRLQLGGLLLAPVSALDGLDGTVARLTGGATRFGAFLDSVLDRISESAVLLGLGVWYMQQCAYVEEALVYAALVGSLLVSYTRARAEGLGLDCKVGLLTRVERCLLLIVALVFNLAQPALWILAIGTLVTTIHRILHVRAQLKGQPL
jgi:CDP-diacylglycerol---glycerol-3-phosphate 3-phosphatidyltransferase